MDQLEDSLLNVSPKSNTNNNKHNNKMQELLCFVLQRIKKHSSQFISDRVLKDAIATIAQEGEVDEMNINKKDDEEEEEEELKKVEESENKQGTYVDLLLNNHHS